MTASQRNSQHLHKRYLETIPTSNQSRHQHHCNPKKQQLWLTSTIFIITIPFSGLLFYYLIQILTENHPKIGSLLPLLGPSDTLLLVTVLSQMLVLLNHVLMNRILDALRWQLAMRREGVKAPIFFVLRSSISFVGAFAMFRNGGKN